MSELESLCRALEDSVQPLPSVAAATQQRSARLRSLAAELQQARSRVRCNCGPDVGRVIQSLHEAAGAADASASSLLGAAQQSKSYVARTIGGSSAGGIGHDVGAGGGPSSQDLSAADRSAILSYTDNGYGRINAVLRSGHVSTAERAEAASLSQALSKLPEHAGTVYRGAALTPDQQSVYIKGGHVREPAFTSASRDAGQAFDGNTVFVINSKGGKSVEQASAFPNELEVLFDQGSTFEVAGTRVDGKTGKLVIFMDEVRR